MKIFEKKFYGKEFSKILVLREISKGFQCEYRFELTKYRRFNFGEKIRGWCKMSPPPPLFKLNF